MTVALTGAVDSKSGASPVVADFELALASLDRVDDLSDRLLQPSLAALRASGREPTVRDADMLEAYVVDLDQRLDNVVLEMAKRHIDSALIVKDGRLAGIFTATDACRWLGELLREDLPTGGDDAA